MNNQRGSIALFLTMFMMLAIVLFGMVIDFSLSHIGKKQVQTVAEAAALAGAISGELVLVTEVDGEGISYVYSARINPDAAERAASDMISRYLSEGLLRSIEIVEIDLEVLDEEGYPTEREGTFYVVTIRGIQHSLFGANRLFSISRQSEAKLEFIGE
jgi:hypothetical protein